MYSRSTSNEGYRVPQNYNGIAFSREKERTEPNKPQQQKPIESKSPISYSERADEHLFGKGGGEGDIFSAPNDGNRPYSNDYFEEELFDDFDDEEYEEEKSEKYISQKEEPSVAEREKKSFLQKKSKRSGDDRFLLALIFLLFGEGSNEDNDILPLLLLLLFLQ